ncbi:MAG: hypothetical protein RJA81_1874 [Planctomycetota bacterium]
METRLFLGFTLLALFGLSWFSVFRTNAVEGRDNTAFVREAAQRGELKKTPPRKSEDSQKKSEEEAKDNNSSQDLNKTETDQAVGKEKDEQENDSNPVPESSTDSSSPPKPVQNEEQRSQQRAMRFFQFMGGPYMDMTSGAIETMILYFLTVGIPIMLPLFWGISRGSAAVAAEIERGTMDMILSRPISRTNFILAHVLLTIFGFLLMIVALVAGNQIGEQFHSVDIPPSALALARPALNVTAMGMAMFGVTLFLSSWDIVRWRPNMIAVILTIAQLVGYAIANQPDTADDSWYKVPGKFSIFSTFYPIESFVKGEFLPRHVTVLFSVAAAGIILAVWRFNSRDLPANS